MLFLKNINGFIFEWKLVVINLSIGLLQLSLLYYYESKDEDVIQNFVQL